jgi:ribosomal protein S14
VKLNWRPGSRKPGRRAGRKTTTGNFEAAYLTIVEGRNKLRECEMAGASLANRFS